MGYNTIIQSNHFFPGELISSHHLSGILGCVTAYNSSPATLNNEDRCIRQGDPVTRPVEKNVPLPQIPQQFDALCVWHKNPAYVPMPASFGNYEHASLISLFQGHSMSEPAGDSVVNLSEVQGFFPCKLSCLQNQGEPTAFSGWNQAHNALRDIFIAVLSPDPILCYLCCWIPFLCKALSHNKVISPPGLHFPFSSRAHPTINIM